MRKIVFYLISILALGCLSLSIQAQSKFVVVIDAGHGGKDGGAVRGIYKEKDINLGVAKVLGELIESNYKDVKVVYTRKSDVFVDLDKRTAIANRAKANLFISIHTNSTAAKVTNVSGADTYILGLARSEESLDVAKRENSVILMEDDYTVKYEGFDPKSPESYIIFEFMSNKYMEQSLQFSELVQSSFRNLAKRNDRGVRQAGFLVLRKTSMPSVLIELGFINNPIEAKFLSSSAGQRSMASAIYAGFKRYKGDFDKKQGRAVVGGRTEIEIEDTIGSEPEIGVIEGKSRSRDIEASAPVAEGKVEYVIQFYVSSRRLSTNSSLFKGLSPVKYYKEGNSYKYVYGSTTDYNEALKLQRQARAKFKDAFLIRLKNGERVK